MHFRTSNLAVILLAYIFFCLTGQSEAFAADVVAPITATDQEGGAESATFQGEAVGGTEIKKGEAADLEDSTEPVFVIAPIPWGGDVSASMSRLNIGPDSSNLQTTQTANLRAITYIWQPWLAQVRGGVGVVNNKNTSGQIVNKDLALNGDGALALLPYSRFPFSASYYLNDRRADRGGVFSSYNSNSSRSGLEVEQRYQPTSKYSDSSISYNKDHYIEGVGSSASKDKINSRFNIQHDYRSSKNSSIYGIGYNRNAYGGGGQASSVTTKMLANYTTRFNYHYLEASSVNTNTESALSGLRLNQVTARHTYRPDKLSSLETSGLASQSELLTLGQNFTNTRNLQINSNASWQPDEELPFYVSGSLRGFGIARNTPAATISTQGLLGVARVNYNATSNLIYQVSEAIGVDRSNGRSGVTSVTKGGANYSSDSTKLGKALHRWNASGALDYLTNNHSSPDLTKSGKAGQSLSMKHLLGKGMVDYSFNQAVSVKDRGGSRQDGTLTHNGGVGWKPAMIKSLSGSGSVTLVDTHGFGNKPSSQQTANLAVNAQYQTTIKSGIFVSSASMLWSVNDGGLSAQTFKLGASYNHPRAFNVVGLRYALAVDVNKHQTNSGSGRANLHDGYSIDQKLEYAVGRAYVKLNGGIVKKAGVKHTLIVVQLGRTFGQI